MLRVNAKILFILAAGFFGPSTAYQTNMPFGWQKAAITTLAFGALGWLTKQSSRWAKVVLALAGQCPLWAIGNAASDRPAMLVRPTSIFQASTRRFAVFKQSEAN